MKHTKSALGLLLCIAFFMAGCFPKDDPEPDPPTPSYSINGYWDRGSIVVHISGDKGTFYQIYSGYWRDAFEQGFVNIGMVKIRYITVVGDKSWTGQNLWCKYSGSTTEEVTFSETGEITLSNDGNTLYVKTKSPWSGSYETNEYTRVSP